MEKDKISVIIPVHNGAKYIRNTANNILNQSYRNLELILVENFSIDESLAICLELQKKDNRVIVLTSNEKGTSLARKKGVEAAGGKYIVFSDQDDEYIDRNALKEMYSAIEEDGSQICQFGYYEAYNFGIKRLKKCTDRKRILLREDLLKREIFGVWGDGESHLNVTVWSKIYAAEVLKSAVSNITIPLYFCEDLYLNTWAFFDDHVQTVSVRAEAYYVWNVGVGFSSSAKAGEVLIREYRVPKDTIAVLCERNNTPTELLYSTHLESLYFLKVSVDKMIKEKRSRNEVLAFITEIDGFDYINRAKRYFNSNKTKSWDELVFLSSDYDAEEYYDYCASHIAKESLKQRIKRWILSIAKSLLYKRM